MELTRFSFGRDSFEEQSDEGISTLPAHGYPTSTPEVDPPLWSALDISPTPERLRPDFSQSPSLASNEAPRGHLTIGAKAKMTWMSLGLWAFVAVYAALYSLYVFEALVSPNSRLGRLLPEASLMNTLISVLSQVFVTLLAIVFSEAFDCLRWHFAASQDGSSLTSFLQLSAATSWLGVVVFTARSPLKSFWGVIRALILPAIWIILGSMLKFGADFEYDFQSTEGELPVYSGVLPMDTSVVGSLLPRVSGVFFFSWVASLLAHPKFSTAVIDPTCQPPCTSFFLSGGIELARRVRPVLNETLLQSGLFKSGDSIQIRNAPGLLLNFSPLDADWKFDVHNDCVKYSQSPNDTLQICIQQVGPSVAAGWQACPSSVLSQNLCEQDTAWPESPTKTKVLLTTYAQFATTTYRQAGYAILNLIRHGDPVLSPLQADGFRAITHKLFQADSNATSTDKAMIQAFTFALTFALRLYYDDFPDDEETPVSYLQNYLAVPIQFMLTAFEGANTSIASMNGPRGTFALPANMTTVAVAGTSSQRLIGQPWVVRAFMAAACSLVAVVGFMRIWMLLQHEQPQMRCAAVPEVAILARAGASKRYQATAAVADSQQQLRPRLTPHGGFEDVIRGYPVPKSGFVDMSDIGGSGYQGLRREGQDDGATRTLLDLVIEERLGDKFVWRLACHVHPRNVKLRREGATSGDLCLYTD